MPQLTWPEAIQKILDEAPGAMHYEDITQKVIADGLRTDLGATPARTVSYNLTTRINKGGDCPWKKVGRGL